MLGPPEVKLLSQHSKEPYHEKSKMSLPCIQTYSGTELSSRSSKGVGLKLLVKIIFQNYSFPVVY